MKHTLSILALTLILGACKQDTCNEPYAFNYDPEGTTSDNCVYSPIQLQVSIHPFFGETEVKEGDLSAQKFETEDGRTLSFSFFGVYLTEISAKVNGAYQHLYSNENCINRTHDAAIITNDMRDYSATILPEKSFVLEALKFNVGVDSCRNYGLDPSTQTDGPFQPQAESMYWSWASGYRFIRLDGMVDTSAAKDGSAIVPFAYHTGLNNFLRQVELSIDEEQEVMDGVLQLDVVLDLKQVLMNVDFPTEISTHTMDNMPLAAKISDNAVTAFTMK